MDKKLCIVCKNLINQDEYSSLAPEFKLYPVHFDCFDTFVNADEFLKFAENKVKTHEDFIESEQPLSVSPS